MRYHSLKRVRFFAAISGVIYVFAGLSTAFAQDAPLNVGLQFENREFRGGSSIVAEVSFENTTQQPIRFLKWETPFDSPPGLVNGDYLNLFRGDERVSYVGPIFKRAPPTPEDYMTIAPGSRASAKVNVEEGYAIGSPGSYTVSFKVEDLEVQVPGRPMRSGRALGPVEKAAAPRLASSSVATFTLIEGRTFKARSLELQPTAKNESCSPDQQAGLTAAVSKAQEIADAAKWSLGATLEADRPSAKRYLNWFGDYSQERYSNSAKHFTFISDALHRPEVTFHCAGDRCASSIYAYVFPTQPYRVYPCGMFWQAGLTGTDSKAGTLVHEISHFTVVSGTRDLVYGQQKALELAQSNPDNALQNADNHEYFAENNPHLPMKRQEGVELNEEVRSKASAEPDKPKDSE